MARDRLCLLEAIMSDINFLQSTHTSMVAQSSVSSEGSSSSSWDFKEPCFENLKRTETGERENTVFIHLEFSPQFILPQCSSHKQTWYYYHCSVFVFEIFPSKYEVDGTFFFGLTTLRNDIKNQYQNICPEQMSFLPWTRHRPQLHCYLQFKQLFI